MINVNLKSPRVILPLTDQVMNLGSSTNLFMVHLGDVAFLNEIKPHAQLSGDESSYNVKISDFKIEFWEDYKDACEALNYKDDAQMLEDDVRQKRVPSFNLAETSVEVMFMKTPSKNKVQVVSEQVLLNMNPYIFKNLMQIPKFFDFQKVSLSLQANPLS